MPPTLERSLVTVRRRALVSAWFERVGVHLAAVLFAAGAVMLALRVAASWDRASAAWWLALAAVAPLTAWWLARRTVPSVSGAATWLDVHSGASGMVVTERELGASSWSESAREHLAEALAQTPRGRVARALKPVLPAAAFCALALWIDPPRVVVGPPPAVATAAIERVEEELRTLQEQVELEPELAAEMSARLEQIEAHADDGLAESTFEALDRLEERIAAEARDAQQRAEQAARDLADVATNPSLADAQASLASALATMQKAGLAKDLPQEATDALQPGTLALPAGAQLSSAELAKLGQALKGALDARIGQLSKAGLLDGKALATLAKLGELAKLGDFDPTHKCTEECLKPGGT